MSAPAVYFVTGTDTGVGKTWISAGLLEAASAAGFSTAAMKPVASGCEQTPDGLRNEDALAVQRFCTVPLTYEQINPFALRAAVAPHLAAIQDGRRLTVDRLAGLLRAVLMEKADLTIVEGAGGWRVPLNERELYSSLPRELNIPVILVVGVRLGCINHALLSAQAILADGLRLAGWVANQIEPDMPLLEENIATLQALLPAPCLGVLPWQEDFSDITSCAEYLDLSALIQRPREMER